MGMRHVFGTVRSCWIPCAQVSVIPSAGGAQSKCSRRDAGALWSWDFAVSSSPAGLSARQVVVQQVVNRQRILRQMPKEESLRLRSFLILN